MGRFGGGVVKLKFNKWVRTSSHVHSHGFDQTINECHINIVFFCFVWKIAEWTEYINHFSEDDSHPYTSEKQQILKEKAEQKRREGVL